ncbi:MAG: aa3-type cytochrome c oxidase subunit IV [Ponticaulis sp.]|nr:aa3-type cytochrome c oxidase subunit IV [Ponticaulis sp.]|tara:strand:+ start:28404 stop:28703 length:300 start_codon:yes stop_codon:yes gene_type:complete
MSGDYVRGEMDITDQENTWTGFMNVTKWSAFIIILVVAYATFTLTMAMPWLVAMGLLAVVGIGGGLFLGMGSAWIATVIGLCVTGVFVQVIIWLAQLAL